jgi:hypothetical protein
MFIRIVTLTEAVVLLLPVSIIWLVGVVVLVGQPTYRALGSGTLPSNATLVVALWLAFCGVGLCALWELFLRHHTYTLRSIPRRVKVGIVLGFVGVVPLALKGGAGAAFAVFVPLLLLVQFYYLIKRNGAT